MLNYSDRLENFKPFKMNKYLKLNLTLNHISTQVDNFRIWLPWWKRYFMEFAGGLEQHVRVTESLIASMQQAFKILSLKSA